jgi:hypothetical protein
MTVRIEPLPAWARATKVRPMHPPVFEGEDPTPDDIALAIDLIEALDADSRAWYGEALVQRLRARLDDLHAP